MHGRLLSAARALLKSPFALMAGMAITALIPVWAQTPSLVTAIVEEANRVTLAGNVSPVVRPGRDLGLVEDSFETGRLYLILKRSNQQEQALTEFLRDAHTPGTASYHQWLTPDEFGKRFGAADSDLAAATAWLESHGFAVNKVHRGRIAIEFSGNAAQIREAFHTEIHRYGVQRSALSETRIANAGNPEIPAALASIVSGVSPMQSLRARPLLKEMGKARYNATTHEAEPERTYPASPTNVTYELGPADFAVQYDVAPEYNTGITGIGQSIGILSYSNVDLSLVQAYQKLFGLPANLPTVVVDGNDPGENADATEAYLDLEQAGAVAPGATVVMYTSAGSVLTDPLLTSGLRAVEDNLVSVISVSAGMCEAELGASGNAAWAALWQEAAAQGITVFVAAGDSGSAGCDDSETQSFAQSGLAVNGLGSTPYNVSVGGTDFYFSDYAANVSTLDSQIGSYWGASSSKTPVVSLLQPSPEQVWNDAFGLNANDGGVYKAADSTIIAGGGGASNAALYPGSGTVTGYPKPSWQAGAGVPNDAVRDLPDVSLFAGDGANFVQYPICAYPGDCGNTTSDGAVQITSVGGTSAAAPAMAAIQALVDQATKSRQGQADYVYYALAQKTLAAKPFRDITTGGNEVPCFAGTLNCVLGASGPTKGDYVESGYPAAAGYDRASGLGTVDVANLIANWSAATFRPTTTTLNITPTTFAHGTAVAVKATVAPASGSGTPTGSVAITSTDPVAYTNGLGVLTLANGTVSSSMSKLPGGTYEVSGEYSGDGSFAASTSTPATVTVTPEKDVLNASGWVLNPVDGNLYPLQAGMSIPYGAVVYVDVEPAGVNEGTLAQGRYTPATGAVTFNDKVGTATQTATVPLNSEGVAEWTPGSLAVGSHVIGAAYAGDASYEASTLAAAATLTVFKGTTTIWLQPMETSVAAGSNVTVDVLLYADFLALSGTLPTGTVTVTLGSQTQTVASPFKSWTTTGGAVEEAVVTFSKVPAGILPLSATYSGDANWFGSSGLFGSVESLAAKPAPGVTLTAAATSFTPGQTVTLTGNVTGTAALGAPSGAVIVSWADGNAPSNAALTAASSTAAAWSLSFPAWQLANGANTVVATYMGDSHYSAQSSAPLILTLNGGDFSLTTTTQEVLVTPGNSVVGTVAVAPINSYSGTVAIACSAPAGITCSAATASPNVGVGVSDAITFHAASTVAVGTYPAVITATGGGHTHTAQILVACTMPATSPTFVPAAGTYTVAQTVTITDATPGASLYYTTDGSAPSGSSARYTSPIAVKSTATVRAVAIAPEYAPSGVASASYTISPTPATPTFSVPSGTYTSAQTVAIADTTSGVRIYYTLNGANPTIQSTLYMGPVRIDSSYTLQAIAVGEGGTPSKVGFASYLLNAAAPVLSPPSGRYPGIVTVTMASASPGASIFYTTNGSAPTAASTRYTAPFVVHASETLSAIAVETGFTSSSVVKAVYTMGPVGSPPTSPVQPVAASAH
ncbi:chitobiase/beta-hexosaminidase C-terminal domain-containing protein [Acidicapsa acidisoli]|uniref:chitobiase/beta-hexosaminidase C-terminal domain-containing protein n=1 Tax=Acidicapsa acidisoli TaxID=1615681 RepID=UPI0021E0BDDE|nr:chitobiase/beta-hexosaminidase C-terminal domain-containing protein [Acidicapsa acidisoli]